MRFRLPMPGTSRYSTAELAGASWAKVDASGANVRISIRKRKMYGTRFREKRAPFPTPLDRDLAATEARAWVPREKRLSWRPWEKGSVPAGYPSDGCMGLGG